MPGYRKAIKKYGSLGGSVIMASPFIWIAADSAKFSMEHGFQHLPARALYDMTGYDLNAKSFNSGAAASMATAIGMAYIGGKAMKYVAKRF